MIWEITKIVLAKQNSSSNETKINNNRLKKIKNLYYLVHENVYAIKHLNWEC